VLAKRVNNCLRENMAGTFASQYKPTVHSSAMLAR